MALPLLGALGSGIGTIGSFFGRTALGAATGTAKIAGKAALGTGKLVGKGLTAPFRAFGSSDKDDGKKLTTQEESVIEQKKDKDEATDKAKNRDAGITDTKKIGKLISQGQTVQEQKSDDDKKQKVKPVLSILQSILSTLEVIKENVATLTKGEERDKRQDKKAALKRLEKEREDARDEDIGPKEPGFIRKSISKIAEKGVGGILSSIFKGIALFFAGKFIIEKFFPNLKEPVFGFFKDIGNFFINLRDSIKALIEGDFGKAFEELKEAGSDAGSIFRKLAKFLSELLDSFLVLLGFDEANLYDKSVKLISDIRPKIKKFFDDMTDYFNSFSDEEDPISTKIMNAITGILGKVFDKIASFLSPANLAAMVSYAMDKGEALEQAEARRKTLEEDRSFERKAKVDAFKQMKAAGVEGLEDIKSVDQFRASLMTGRQGQRKRRTDLTEQELKIEKALEEAYQAQLDAKMAKFDEIGEVKELQRKLKLQEQIAPNSEATQKLREEIQEKTSKFPQLQEVKGAQTQRKLKRENIPKTLTALEDVKMNKNLEFEGNKIATSSYAAFGMNEGNKSYNISNDQIDQSMTSISNAKTVQIDGSPTNIMTADPTSSSYFRPVK